ncbi:MAG: ribosome-associated protein YbcJ [Rahnella inusitata]|jgi:ribosome-associated protein|uniref:Ribosome-associated protein YbcJ n=1 Tax=Rahnella inusitata TaxID=58169 RepID=A0ABX9P4M0_9GAMM|nr:ribosome-associated protein YbcJ [Rahnella inusitata]NMC25434.1 ribosome-associated protein YbcJ [Serratia sp. (in: enterobacteria)]QLK60338.1 ribosome-associated protein YbcJ [Enterobacteriaceae bacterium Kacie_13]QUT14575.1 ribosome-associated protein YbcJ [Rahnella inusitata]RJT14377.1 ribosome-associated protein YbcJ [Rahnella inusitata]
METFFLEKHPHVELCDLLKFMGWCDSGGSAKSVISEGQVKVNGKVETRRRCKIVADQQVEFASNTVVVKASAE